MTNLTKSLKNLTDTGQETAEILVSEHQNDPLVVLAVSLIGLVIVVGCPGNTNYNNCNVFVLETSLLKTYNCFQLKKRDIFMSSRQR